MWDAGSTPAAFTKMCRNCQARVLTCNFAYSALACCGISCWGSVLARNQSVSARRTEQDDVTRQIAARNKQLFASRLPGIIENQSRGEMRHLARLASRQWQLPNVC